MSENQTTAAVQRFLDDLAGSSPSEPVIRALLDRAVRRLEVLCMNFLRRKYPRLMSPPLNLKSDELLGGVVERLLKALRAVHPQTVRQFFALANQHIHWELNDLARRLDTWIPTLSSPEAIVVDSSDSGVTLNARRMLEAIELLPEEEREVFNLVRIQGLQHNEVAQILGVSQKTVQRRLNKGLLMLTEKLNDLRPGDMTRKQNGG